MALPVSDAFTDTNGVTLPGHNASYSMNNGAFQINTNALAPNSAAAEICGRWNGDVPNDDQYSKITLVALTAYVYVGPAVRAINAATATYYGYYGNNVDRYLFKNVGGTWTRLGAIGGACSLNDILEIRVVGNVITPYINGSVDTSIGAQTDSAITTGRLAITGYDASTSIRGDNWEGGNTSATTPISASDSGTGSETATIAISSSPAETAAGADNASIASTFGVSDTGAGSETVTPAVSLPTSDSGSGSQSESLIISSALDDSATGSESTTLAIAADISDSASGTENISIDTGGTPVPVSDSGTLSDALTLAIDSGLTDSAVGSDQIAIAVSFSFSENGSAVDQTALAVNFSPTEAGIATEALSLSAALAISDTGAGVQFVSVSGPVVIPANVLVVISRINGVLCEGREIEIVAEERSPAIAQVHRPNAVVIGHR